MNPMLTRRHFIWTSAMALAAAKTSAFAQEGTLQITVTPDDIVTDSPLVPYSDDPLAPTLVNIAAGIGPGEIHVDPNRFRLYWTLENGQAIRYAVGIGRRGLYESGSFRVGAKREWPSWTPTANMIRRSPKKYARYAKGVPGGPGNPLGARALYLYRGNRDTYYRIHGTTEPQSIGQSVSNGCIRMINDHVIDLYNRVPVGTTVVVV